MNNWRFLKFEKRKIQWRKNGGVGDEQKNLLFSSQNALAVAQNVRSKHGLCQNLRENCTVLMVPCWVPYDHYKGRYSNSKTNVKLSSISDRTLYIFSGYT